jgi:hypothetical protein
VKQVKLISDLKGVSEWIQCQDKSELNGLSSKSKWNNLKELLNILRGKLNYLICECHG